MASVKVHIDMRPYTNKIRKNVKDRYIESVTKPGVKTEIYETIYDNVISDSVPVDTGALFQSPLMAGGVEEMGTSKKHPKYKGVHYAHGDINDKGIMFDPYTVTKNEGEVHYASDVESFKPYAVINDSKERAYEHIKDIIVREMNDG